MSDAVRKTELTSNRVYYLALDNKIPKTAVHTTVTEFVALCNNMLRNHYRVEIPNMITIIPENETEYNATFGYIMSQLADSIGEPVNTVIAIIEQYLDSVKKDLYKGNNTGIRGLVRFMISRTSTGYSVQTSMSGVFREKSDIAVRVHTARQLKSDVNRALSAS